MRPMLDPKRDLAGATPETLARALLRPLRRGGREDESDTGTEICVVPRIGAASSVGHDGGEEIENGMPPVIG